MTLLVIPEVDTKFAYTKWNLWTLSYFKSTPNNLKYWKEAVHLHKVELYCKFKQKSTKSVFTKYLLAARCCPTCFECINYSSGGAAAGQEEKHKDFMSCCHPTM